MIKVIVKKNKCKCMYCGSLLRYQIEDLKEDRQHGEIWGYYIKCPVCKGETTVSRTIL